MTLRAHAEEQAALKQVIENALTQAAPIGVSVTIGSDEPFWITSDKDLHFTGAIIENAEEDENLAGLGGNKIVITDVIFEGKETLQFRLLFWSTNTFEDADLDVDSFLGFVDLDVPNNGFQKGGAGQWYLNVTDVNLHYEDEDASNELHVSLNCVSAAGKTAGVPGEVKIKIGYKVRE